MDDILEILIPLLIFVVASVAGAVRKKNKTKRQPTSQNPTFPDIEPKEDDQAGFDPFKELFEEESPVKEEYTEADEFVISETKTIESETSNLETIPSEEGIPVFQKTSDVLLSDDKPEDQSLIDNQKKEKPESEITEQDEIVSNFDARKAIIYSEILKRKYF